ncbi:hypothetical protein H5410_050438, partial [Solanum commersonii]
MYQDVRNLITISRKQTSRIPRTGTRQARRIATLPSIFEKTSRNPTDSQQPTNKEKKRIYFSNSLPLTIEEEEIFVDETRPQGRNHAALAAATVRRSGFLIVELLELTLCPKSRILTLQLLGFASGVWSARVLRCKEESATGFY